MHLCGRFSSAGYRCRVTRAWLGDLTNQREGISVAQTYERLNSLFADVPGWWRVSDGQVDRQSGRCDARWVTGEVLAASGGLMTRSLTGEILMPKNSASLLTILFVGSVFVTSAGALAQSDLPQSKACSANDGGWSAPGNVPATGRITMS